MESIMQVLLGMYDYLSVRRMSVALLILNVIAAVMYVYAAMPSWVIPIERAQGINTVTGEPFVWAVRALPIVAVFFLINLIWGTGICLKRNWQNGGYGLLPQ
jgi:hypothetical protein